MATLETMASAFRFLDLWDYGPVADGELELVEPSERWVEALLAAVRHPDSSADPSTGSLTRSRVLEYLLANPRGRHPGDPQKGYVPSYHFWMRLRAVKATELNGAPLPRWGQAQPPIEIAGGITLRVGNTPDIQMYVGHIGYGVYPPARGHHYAERACRLIFPLARAHGLRRLWITTNPDNWPSRRTCERLGCRLAEIVPLPHDHPLYQKGEKFKCRYWLDL
ncbi:GNAT family N-acetyltransferase [Fontivita pretiosa]|uniref:GNAT family N-acetyltransferase n=1 Tax=Fontivita pretiosa TaxID=2989684 RepID=UPI003D16BAAE